eukprot:TRINITY_DN2264_c0_g1_i1.p1 TRINITY_DN2264_c0_g1~~TRINITY_DN2264_c0_g1_i1.p1  ORF type:complete len:563 (-),score=82.50 TRINITY_DN2264_c0_g1_i1:553-2241(-)
MVDGDAASTVVVDKEYIDFFLSLSVSNNVKATFLARQLQAIYAAAVKLDEHLAPIGTALHCAISRMCPADSPLQAPQHRWIRVCDRAGFFFNEDAYSCQVINIGLAYAYRHKELEALAEANAVVLKQLRLSKVGEKAPGDETKVPAGATSFLHAGLRGTDGRVPDGVGMPRNAPAANKSERDGDEDVIDADGALEVPLGGAVLRQSADSADRLADVVPEPGGLVVAWRGAAADVSSDAPAALLPIVEAPARKPILRTIVDSQPLLAPSDAALRGVKDVLVSFTRRVDAKEVLRDLLCRGLVCWGRLVCPKDGTETTPRKDKTDDGWAEVRVLLAQFWPSWKVPERQPARIPPEGSVASLSHSGSCSQSGKWTIPVDMAGVNPVIRGMAVKSQRYFNKQNLSNVVEVSRMGADAKPPLPITVASMLVVGTWDTAFCSVLRQFAFTRQAPILVPSPLASAAFHNLETACLRESHELLSASKSDKCDEADGSDVDGSDSDDYSDSSAEDGAPPGGVPRAACPQLPDLHMGSTAKRPRSSLVKERQAEINELLAKEKSAAALASRA